MTRAHASAQSADKSRVKIDLKVIWRLWSYVRPHQKLFWTSFTVQLVTSCALLASPWIFKAIIDEDLPTKDMESLRLHGLIFAAIAIVDVFGRYWQTWTLDLAGQNALLDLRLAVFRHLQRLSSRFYDKTPIGRLVGRVTTDIEALQEMFSSGLVTVLVDLVLLVAIIVILLLHEWRLALVTFSTVPILLALTLFIRNHVRRGYNEMIRRRSRLNAFLHEQLGGMYLVQLFGREADTRERFQEESSGMRDSQLGTVWWESALSASTEMVGSFTVALILWYGGGLVLEDLGLQGTEADPVMTVGFLFLFIQYMRIFFGPLNDLSLKYTVMQNAMTASERIFTLLDEKDITPEPEQPVTPAESAGAIEFENVTFGYDPDSPVLTDLSFRVEPGERVAIVGATGGGKTTLLKLLTRLYDVQSGAIRIDGVDIRERSLNELRSTVGIVPQDVFLFGGDILENIRLGHPEITKASAIASANSLHLDQIVDRFPRGYREPVRERGANLSSGERQLIAFARVLAVAPRILALDEATSNVDTRTEQLLQDAVHRLMQGRTALIIAHRLSTIRDVDRILVVVGGRIVEQGSHDELMRKQGAYWNLVQLQYADQSAD